MLAEIVPAATLDTYREFYAGVAKLLGHGLEADEWEVEVTWLTMRLQRRLEKVDREMRADLSRRFSQPK